jgi:uncharacterized RDD family membrane protein YckC
MANVSTQPRTADVVLPGEQATSETTYDELAYAGIPRRAAAILLDGVVLFAAYWAIGTVIAALTGGLVSGGFELTGIPALVAMMAYLAVGFGYFILLEERYGRTLGKRLLGLRVVNEDGSPITMGTSVVRNVIRIVDGLFFYAVGAVSMLVSGKKQRLGDRVANTVVVRSK